MTPKELYGTTQEFLVPCPGCNGTGRSMYSAGSDKRCINCSGKGQKLMRFNIPKPGDRVKVKVGFERMLIDLFGLDDKKQPKVTTETVGVVHDLQMPEEHHLELSPTGLGVRVNFEGGLKKTGEVPKNKQVDLWTFDLYELKAAK